LTVWLTGKLMYRLLDWVPNILYQTDGVQGSILETYLRLSSFHNSIHVGAKELG
jgi:hypothetical protein